MTPSLRIKPGPHCLEGNAIITVLSLISKRINEGNHRDIVIRSYKLINQKWFSIVCTLIKNDKLFVITVVKMLWTHEVHSKWVLNSTQSRVSAWSSMTGTHHTDKKWKKTGKGGRQAHCKKAPHKMARWDLIQMLLFYSLNSEGPHQVHILLNSTLQLLSEDKCAGNLLRSLWREQRARMAQSVSVRPWRKSSWVWFSDLASLFWLLSFPCS